MEVDVILFIFINKLHLKKFFSRYILLVIFFFLEYYNMPIKLLLLYI